MAMIEIRLIPDSPEMMAKVIKLLADLGDSLQPEEHEPLPTTMAAEEIEETVSEPAAVLPEVSLEQVRARLAELSAEGKTGPVKEILKGLGASKLTEVPAEKYGELLAATEGL
jgi:hypothetical protein